MYELLSMSVTMSSYFSYILSKGVQKRSIPDNRLAEQASPIVANTAFLVTTAWVLVPEQQVGGLRTHRVVDVSTFAKLAFVSAFS